jgi:hypothetical protein
MENAWTPMLTGRLEDGQPLVLALADLPRPWAAGLVGMRAGERRRVWLPPRVRLIPRMSP